MRVQRINANYAAFEAFTDNENVNKDIISGLNSVADLRKVLADMPYFKDYKKDSSTIGWLAFPIDGTKYELFIYQFDDISGAIFLTKRVTVPFRSYSDIVEAYTAQAATQNVLANPYTGEGEEVPTVLSDVYLEPLFQDAKALVLSNFSMRESQASPTIEEVIRQMRNVGGETTFNGKTGIPVIIEYDWNAKKLRAKTNDGVHGLAFVAFPNSERIEDAVYIVPQKDVKWQKTHYRIENKVPLANYRVR